MSLLMLASMSRLWVFDVPFGVDKNVVIKQILGAKQLPTDKILLLTDQCGDGLGIFVYTVSSKNFTKAYFDEFCSTHTISTFSFGVIPNTSSLVWRTSRDQFRKDVNRAISMRKARREHVTYVPKGDVTIDLSAKIESPAANVIGWRTYLTSIVLHCALFIRDTVASFCKRFRTPVGNVCNTIGCNAIGCNRDAPIQAHNANWCGRHAETVCRLRKIIAPHKSTEEESLARLKENLMRHDTDSGHVTAWHRLFTKYRSTKNILLLFWFLLTY